MNKLIWIVLAIIVVGGGIYYFATTGYKTPVPTNNSNPSTQTTDNNVVTPTPAIGTRAVTIQNFTFNPSTLTVAKGTTVVWTNQDPTSHKIASDTNAFGSGSLGQGSSYSFKFDTAGTYTYHCAIHPTMTGTIIVQ